MARIDVAVQFEASFEANVVVTPSAEANNLCDIGRCLAECDQIAECEGPNASRDKVKPSKDERFLSSGARACTWFGSGCPLRCRSGGPPGHRRCHSSPKITRSAVSLERLLSLGRHPNLASDNKPTQGRHQVAHCAA